MTAKRTIPTPNDPRLDVWRSFLQAHWLIRTRLERELEDEQGMGLGEYEVLLVLAYSDGRRQRMSDLASSLMLSRSGATRLIDRMERAGYVERASCETDRRGQWAQLTDAGYQRLRSASPTHLRGIGEHFLDRIPADELDELHRILERMVVAESSAS